MLLFPHSVARPSSQELHSCLGQVRWSYIYEMKVSVRVSRLHQPPPPPPSHNNKNQPLMLPFHHLVARPSSQELHSCLGRARWSYIYEMKVSVRVSRLYQPPSHSNKNKPLMLPFHHLVARPSSLELRSCSGRLGELTFMKSRCHVSITPLLS